MLSKAAAQVDRLVGGAAVSMLSRHRVATLSHDERVESLKSLAEFYGERRFIDDPDTFFPRVEMAPDLLLLEEQRACDVHLLQWRSDYQPLLPAVAEKYRRDPLNLTAQARLYTSGEPGRPAVVLIHGYLCGQWALEERLWPINALVRWGLDVALLVLPFHAVRGTGMGKPPFPGADPRINVEGFRHSVMDVRALVAWLRARGAPAVGLMGMSLGGYVSALCATLDELDFVVPMIPLGSIADFARDGGRLGEDPDERYEQHRWMEAAHAVVSPFSRPSRVPGRAALVITGDGDRITPSAHAHRLADHLGARTHVFHGGHLLQFGRANAFRAVGSMLDRLGLRHTADDLTDAD